MRPILSASSIIGCSRTNQGCLGGYPFLVGKHTKEFGMVDESCQEYENKDEICSKKCFKDNVYKAIDYGY